MDANATVQDKLHDSSCEMNSGCVCSSAAGKWQIEREVAISIEAAQSSRLSPLGSMLRPVHAGPVVVSSPDERIEPRFVLRGHRCTIGALCFIDTQQRRATTTDPQQKRSTPTHSTDTTTAHAPASQDTSSLVLVSGDEQGTVHCWSLHACRSIHSFNVAQPISATEARTQGKVLPTILAIQAWRRTDDHDEDDQRDQQQQQSTNDDSTSIDSPADDCFTLLVQSKDGTISLWSIRGLIAFTHAATTQRRTMINRGGSRTSPLPRITSHCRFRIATRAYGFMPAQVHLNLQLPNDAFTTQRNSSSSSSSTSSTQYRITTVALIPTDQPSVVQLIALHSHQSLLACDVECASSCARTAPEPENEIMSRIKAEIATEFREEQERKSELLRRFRATQAQAHKLVQLNSTSNEDLNSSDDASDVQPIEAPIHTVPYTGIAMHSDTRVHGMVMCAVLCTPATHPRTVADWSPNTETNPSDQQRPPLLLLGTESGHLSVYGIDWSARCATLFVRCQVAKEPLLSLSLWPQNGVSSLQRTESQQSSADEPSADGHESNTSRDDDECTSNLPSSLVQCLPESICGVCCGAQDRLSVFSYNTRLSTSNTNAQSKHRIDCHHFALPRAGLNCVALRPGDGRILATAGWDKRVRLYSSKSLTPLCVLPLHTQQVQRLCFAPDATDNGLLATASADGRIALYTVYPQHST